MGVYYALSLQKPPQKEHNKSPLVNSRGLVFIKRTFQETRLRL
jgi:hypothetical protein